MQQSVILHMLDEEQIIGEVDELPNMADRFMILSHPRRRDGIRLDYVQEGVTAVLIPWHRIQLVEFLPEADIENVIGFVRE